MLLIVVSSSESPDLFQNPSNRISRHQVFFRLGEILGRLFLERRGLRSRDLSSFIVFEDR